MASSRAQQLAEDEDRAAAAIQARTRGHQSRKEGAYVYKQDDSLKWLKQLQAKELDEEAVDVNFLQSEALLALERQIKEVSKEQKKAGQRLRDLETLGGGGDDADKADGVKDGAAGHGIVSSRAGTASPGASAGAASRPAGTVGERLARQEEAAGVAERRADAAEARASAAEARAAEVAAEQQRLTAHVASLLEEQQRTMLELMERWGSQQLEAQRQQAEEAATLQAARVREEVARQLEQHRIWAEKQVSEARGGRFIPLMTPASFP